MSTRGSQRETRDSIEWTEKYLKSINLHSGGMGTGTLAGFIQWTVGGSTSLLILSPYSTTSTTMTLSAGNTVATNALLDNYNIPQMGLNGTGDLINGTDYTLTAGGVITRLGGQTFANSEIYTIPLYTK
jgi:hypothetical protein